MKPIKSKSRSKSRSPNLKPFIYFLTGAFLAFLIAAIIVEASYAQPNSFDTTDSTPTPNTPQEVQETKEEQEYIEANTPATVAAQDEQEGAQQTSPPNSSPTNPNLTNSPLTNSPLTNLPLIRRLPKVSRSFPQRITTTSPHPAHSPHSPKKRNRQRP